MDAEGIIEVDMKAHEKKRVIETKSHTYLERLERLMILIEVSYTLRTVNRISFQKMKI